MQKTLLLALLALIGSEVQAEGWTGKGELGLAVARGNSKSETLNA